MLPIKNEYIENSHELLKDVSSKIIAHNIVKDGDVVVMTGSSQYSPGVTNMLQAHTVGGSFSKGGKSVAKIRIDKKTGHIYKKVT